MAGRISRKLVTEGNLVNANTTMLTTIVTTDPIYFYFDIDERSFLGRYVAHPLLVVSGDVGDQVLLERVRRPRSGPCHHVVPEGDVLEAEPDQRQGEEEPAEAGRAPDVDGEGRGGLLGPGEPVSG